MARRSKQGGKSADGLRAQSGHRRNGRRVTRNRPFNFVYAGPPKLVDDFDSSENTRLVAALGAVPSEQFRRGLLWTVSLYVDQLQKFRAANPRAVEVELGRFARAAYALLDAATGLSLTARNLLSTYSPPADASSRVLRELGESLSKLLPIASKAVTSLQGAPRATAAQSEYKACLAKMVAWLVYIETKKDLCTKRTKPYLRVLVGALNMAQKRLGKERLQKDARSLGVKALDVFDREEAKAFFDHFR